jgi:hypothetical protein
MRRAAKKVSGPFDTFDRTQTFSRKWGWRRELSSETESCATFDKRIQIG